MSTQLHDVNCTPIKEGEVMGAATSPSHSLGFPVTTKRTRTLSQSERAALGETFHGKIVSFCRQKGHGFIQPNEPSDAEPIFVHITDIDGEFVPHADDVVTYKKIPCPPKEQKFQAVHVKIINFSPGRHETWSDPVTKEH